MTRLALLIGETPETGAMMAKVGAPFGMDRVQAMATLAEALEVISRQDIDLVVVPVDQSDESLLTRLEHHARSQQRMSVIATASTQDPQLILRAMRAGIQEFLTRPLVHDELAAALRRLRHRVVSRNSSGMVIAVFSAKGGVGTTTVAVNLAAALAVNHGEQRVALVDLASPRGAVPAPTRRSGFPTPSQSAGRGDLPHVDPLVAKLVSAEGGVWTLAANGMAGQDSAVDPRMVSPAISQLRRNFGFTVIDCEHQLNDRTLAALDRADRILLLTELRVPVLRTTQRMLALFRRLGYSDEKLCVVLNRLRQDDVLSALEGAHVLRTDIFFRLADEAGILRESAAAGRSVMHLHPESSVAGAFLQLARKVGGNRHADTEVL